MFNQFNRNIELKNILNITKTKKKNINTSNYILSLLLLRDMMYFTKIWRMIKGYSSNNQRSHSNNKGSKHNKKILLFRINQFYQLFGKKKRDIFPTLVVAEYTNRL